SNLRCAIVGFSLQCVPAGTGDVNATCTSASDCLRGLSCASGKCAVGVPGLPFGAPLWAGDTCPAETGSAVAWFRVPRGKDDGDFYRLPFPNDIRIKSGHPDLSGHPTPGSSLLGYDLVDRILRGIEEENDGWSTSPTIFFRFNTDIDYHSFDPPND